MHIFFYFETCRLNLAHTRLSYTILRCIIGVLKKSFEPAVNASRDRTAGEHFVSCATELSATPFYIRVLLLCIFSTGMLVHFLLLFVNLYYDSWRHIGHWRKHQ